jgi:cell filamentation protein
LSENNKLKYQVSSLEDSNYILPNILNLDKEEDIERAEFEGFLRSERIMIETLSRETLFNNKYIQTVHYYALYHLYSFAGNYRTVNMSKDGFFFPPARYIPESMNNFEKNILNNLPDSYQNQIDLIKDIALIHSELLFIHPFREGNGRTARIIANMMSYKAGYNRLKFEEITKKNKFDKYVLAVQKAGIKKYNYMIEIIEEIF